MLSSAVSVAGGSKLVDRLLKLGASPSLAPIMVEPPPSGWTGAFGGDLTALHSAVSPEKGYSAPPPDEEERLKNIQLLLAHGANPNAEGFGPGFGGANGFVLCKGGITPLLSLSTWTTPARLRAAEALLEAGADPNLPSLGADSGIPGQQGAQLDETPVLVANRLGDAKLQALYQRHGGVLFDVKAEEHAATEATGAQLKKLLARKDVRSWRVLSLHQHALESRRPGAAGPQSTFLDLVRAGMDLTTRSRPDKNAVDGLCVAREEVGVAAHTEQALEELLATGVPVDFTEDSGVTALMDAAWEGRTSVVKRLLQHGANVNACTRNGETALTRALYAHSPSTLDTANELLAAGAEVNVTTETGRTPLFYAVASSWPQLVEVLVARGADPNAPISEHRGLPLWAALLARESAPKGLMGPSISYDTLKAVLSAPSLKVDLQDQRILTVLERAKEVPELEALAVALLKTGGPLDRNPALTFTGAQEGVLATHGVDVFHFEGGQLFLNAFELSPHDFYGRPIPLDSSTVFEDEGRLVFVPRFTAQELSDIHRIYTSSNSKAYAVKEALPELYKRISRGAFAYDIAGKGWIRESDMHGRLEHAALLKRVDEAGKPLSKAMSDF